jgi:hypothetical protein
MQAIEFDTTAQDGVLKIPAEHRDWYNRPVRVFLQPGPMARSSNQPSEAEIRAFFAGKQLDLRDYRFDREEVNAR